MQALSSMARIGKLQKRLLKLVMAPKCGLTRRSSLSSFLKSTRRGRNAKTSISSNRQIFKRKFWMPSPNNISHPTLPPKLLPSSERIGAKLPPVSSPKREIRGLTKQFPKIYLNSTNRIQRVTPKSCPKMMPLKLSTTLTRITRNNLTLSGSCTINLIIQKK